MEFLSTHDLEAMELKQLVAYKSLLTHISELKEVETNDIVSKLAEAKVKIKEKLTEDIKSHSGISAKEMSTAIALRDDGKKFLDGILDELRKAREKQEYEDKMMAEDEQKEALIAQLMPVYVDWVYPMPMVVEMLGRTVLKVADKETLAKLVGLDKETLAQIVGDKETKPKETKNKGNREIAIEH